MTLLVPVLLLLVGAALAAGSARALEGLWRSRRIGTLVAVDAGRPATLRAPRYRMVGRPDILRRHRDGRIVPIEVKRRDAPVGGPFRSHEVQVWAYCLLVEETTGTAPPFGVLQYSDREYRIPWNASARSALLSLRRSVLTPYDGRATPSPGRCRRCPWSSVCDVRAS